MEGQAAGGAEEEGARNKVVPSTGAEEGAEDDARDVDEVHKHKEVGWKKGKTMGKTLNRFQEGGSDIEDDDEDANSDDKAFEDNSADFHEDCEICKANT